ncbi:MAG: transposase [Bacteroidales bacterium]|jgi:transposase|nr:transposase [Bacteroidales bacterium]
MYNILDKDTIENEILPFLSTAKRGFATKSSMSEIVNSILYKFKTGIQWEYLPVESLFSDVVLSYKSVHKNYRKWCKNDEWRSCWIKLLSRNKDKLDISSGDVDGSHSPALKGGEEVSYQGRKKKKTTNSIFLTDRQGLPLAMSNPVGGNHHDLYNIEESLGEIFGILEEADISLDGLFLNADGGFDSEIFRRTCVKKSVIPNVDKNKRKGNVDEEEFLDDELYKLRYSIERTNAWMDSYRTLLNRFDTKVSSWKGWNFISFIVIALKKFNKNKSR